MGDSSKKKLSYEDLKFKREEAEHEYRLDREVEYDLRRMEEEESRAVARNGAAQERVEQK